MAEAHEEDKSRPLLDSDGDSDTASSSSTLAKGNLSSPETPAAVPRATVSMQPALPGPARFLGQLEGERPGIPGHGQVRE